MATILTDVGLIFTATLGHIGDVVGLITGEPLLMIPVAFMIIGFAVGLLTRIMRSVG